MKWPSKDPDEVLDYMIDWTRRLRTDEIATATFSKAVESDVEISQESHTTKTATVWVSGGTEGQSASIHCRITTVGGRTMEQTVELPIATK